VDRAVLAHEIEEIVVKERWDNPVGRSLSASQGVVGQEQLELRPILRTGEILEVVPGLIVTQHSGTGKSNQMFLRGFNLDHGTDFATWVDGMPVNMRTHAHGQGYTDLNFLMPELIESVEYLKGPYYAGAGDFSAAGSAHIRTFDSLEQGQLKAGLGEDGYARFLAADSVAVAGGELLAAGVAHFYDGPWDDIDEDLKRYSGMLKYSHRHEDGSFWGAALYGYDAEWNSADQIPRRAVREGLISDRGSLDKSVGGESSRYSLSAWGDDRLGPGLLSANAYAIYYDLDLWSNFTYFLDDPVDGDQFRQSDDRMIYGGSLDYGWGHGERSIHRLGAELRYDDIDGVGLYNTRDRRRLGTVREDDVEQLSVAVYYQNEFLWTDKLRSILGVRGDYYDFDVRSDLDANSGNEDDAQLSPKLTLIYGVSEALELYASAGRGFHSNDARGTTINVDPVSGDPVQSVDPIVSADGAETGFRFFWQDRLNVSMALWYLELDSELLFVGDAGTTEPVRGSRRYGVELPVYLLFSDYYSADLEVALSHAEFKTDRGEGDDIPGAVDTVIAAGLSARYPSGPYGSLRARYFGERPLTEDGDVKSGATLTFNAMIGYERGPLDLRLEVLNLFDSDDDDITYYYASRLQNEPLGGVEDIHFHPIEPRTVRGYVTWRF
jgi:outer membrane receptor protein involved in Fe transport